MSGDVQPRKRKDKRRKKADGDYHIQRIRGASFDDDDAGTPPPTLINPSSEHSTDNVTIHVHKEGGTGGHWCARIIFFALLSVLVGLVGLIIFEHRGITDVDTPVTTSRWAVIFDGWVDDIIPQHDDEPHEEENNASEETDEHGDEDTEEEEEEEEEDEHGDEEEEEEEDTEEDDKSENAADKDSSEVDEGIGSEEEAEDDEEEEEEERDESENDENDEDQQISVEEEIVQQSAYRQKREIASDQGDDDSREKTFDEGFDEGNSVEDNEDTLEELDENSEEDTNDVSAEDEEDNEEEESNDEDEEEEEEEANNLLENDLDVSIEGIRASREGDEEDVSQEYFSIPGVGEIDDNSAEPLEEIEEGDLEEVVNELEIEPEEEEEIEEESASVAVKFGVGVALIVAAHFVLVRRWNNVEADLAGSYSDEVLDLSRRNTIVPPLNPKDLIITNEPDEQATIYDEKIVESYEELRNKYKNLEVENPLSSKKILGMENVQLRNTSMQEKSLLEDKRTLLKTDMRQKEEEVEDMQTSESERLSATEPEEDEEEEVSEEEESEEVEDEEEEEEEEEEDIEVPDDSELVAKLEAKYGKLPTPTESEDEEDYDDEDEDEELDEEADEEDEEMQGWKRVRAPKGPHSGGPEAEKRQETRGKEPATKVTSSTSKSGPKGIHENVNDSSVDEVSIQEEINSWLSKEFDN